jgi:preprotein translocase subunit Sec63
VELIVDDDSWYVLLENDISIEQGDIIEDCKIIVPCEDGYQALLSEADAEVEQEMEFIQGNFIIMSQSCDLSNDKIDSVVVCLIVSLRDASTMFPNLNLESSGQKEVLRRGNIPSLHLLNQLKLQSQAVEDFYCVCFEHIYSVPKKYLLKLIEPQTRNRLLSPYKESLAQSFAKYFMRVGLPRGIDKTELKEYVIQKKTVK